MKQDVSEIAFEGVTAQGASVKVYRALRTLLCERCGEQITEGQLFTRWPINEQLLRIMPRCRRCVPFEPAERTEKPRSSSPLIARLLDQPRAESDEGTPNSQAGVEQAIEKRLGPALRWTRGSGTWKRRPKR